MSETPRTTDQTCDSRRNPQIRSNMNVIATTVSRITNNHLQPRIEFAAGALILMTSSFAVLDTEL